MQVTLTLPTSRSAILPQPVLADISSMHKDFCLDSEALLRGNKSVTITHNGSVYRLQATKLGKLILTK